MTSNVKAALILALRLIIAAVFNGGIYQVRYINGRYGFRFDRFTGQAVFIAAPIPRR
jgi:hypothetical protein